MLDLLDDPLSELVDLFLAGREYFLAAGCCQSEQSVVGTARQSMAGVSSVVLIFSMASSTDTLSDVSRLLPIVFPLPLSPYVLPFLWMEITVVSGLAVEEGRRGMDTLWRLPIESTPLRV